MKILFELPKTSRSTLCLPSRLLALALPIDHYLSLSILTALFVSAFLLSFGRFHWDTWESGMDARARRGVYGFWALHTSRDDASWRFLTFLLLWVASSSFLAPGSPVWGFLCFLPRRHPAGPACSLALDGVSRFHLSP